jgi:hypothetical protein
MRRILLLIVTVLVLSLSVSALAQDGVRQEKPGQLGGANCNSAVGKRK